MEGGRRVFPSIDKTKMFLRGTPTDSSSVGFFFLQSFVSFFFFLQMELLQVKESCNKTTAFYLKMVILSEKWKCYLLKYLTCKTI